MGSSLVIRYFDTVAAVELKRGAGGAHDKLKIVPGSIAELQLALAKKRWKPQYTKDSSKVACSAPTIATLRRFRLANWLLLQ